LVGSDFLVEIEAVRPSIEKNPSVQAVGGIIRRRNRGGHPERLKGSSGSPCTAVFQRELSALCGRQFATRG
jgi:hypothetical protein